MSQRQTLAPDAAAIERLADEAISRLPEQFRRHLEGVVFRIEEFADDETLDKLGIDNPFELSGLYRGRPIGEQSSMISGELPAMIHLYRRPLLDEPLNGLDGEGQDRLAAAIADHRAGGGGLLAASHQPLDLADAAQVALG